MKRGEITFLKEILCKSLTVTYFIIKFQKTRHEASIYDASYNSADATNNQQSTCLFDFTYEV
jgi:hypothetical protein